MDLMLHKGDIVRNRFAGSNNPHRYLLYLGEHTIRQGRYRSKGYLCLGYDQKKVELFRQDEPLEYIGHMKEYDDFIKALKRLQGIEREE